MEIYLEGSQSSKLTFEEISEISGIAIEHSFYYTKMNL